MPSPESPDVVSQLVERASKLRIDAAVADLCAHFQSDGVHAILLKGASLEFWLYPGDSPRLYGDGDLLVAPGDLDAAQERLSELGYRCAFDDKSMPSWWREHSSPWFRGSDGVTIDLHRSLPGARVQDGVAWRVLSRDSDAMIVAGRSVPALGLPARAMHVVLHAAQHGAGSRQPLAELERALAVADDELWHDAATLAHELDAMEAFAAGLDLTDAGRQLAAQLRLCPARSVETALRATSPPPVALGFEQLAQAEGVRARLEIVWRKLVPPPAFIRHWDPRSRQGGVALVRAYMRRPVWILRHTAPGFKAWFRARRSLNAARRR
ncbi:MAG: nucleotidyltransferase family protein [Solirubrobacteraceae bacterium]